jgi:hypothetical protein
MDINNFENFTKEEYLENLKRLGIEKYSSLVGKEVFYSIPIYGKHKVLNWDENKGEYLLEYGGYKFLSNPFRIFIC